MHTEQTPAPSSGPFYVLGWASPEGSERLKLIPMTSKSFPTADAARAYAATCHPSYRAFVAAALDKPE